MVNALAILLLLALECIHGVHPSGYCKSELERLANDTTDLSTCKRILREKVTCVLQLDLKEPIYDNQDCDIESTELIISDADTNEILSKTALTMLTNITKLTINHTRINAIEPGTFERHPHITEAYIRNNYLVSISGGIFTGLRELDNLFLAHNRIEYISDDAFLGTNLRELDLSGNSIKELGSWLRHLPHLESLGLGFNQLTHIENCPEETSTNDTETRLSSCIPINTSIKILCVRANKLEHFEPTNANLKRLNLSKNPSIHFTINFFIQSTGLQILFLNQNGITAIPKSLFEPLGNLTILDLSYNNLASFIYGTFDGLSNLQTLDVSGNKLTSLPVAFHSLASLKDLYLENNYLHDMNVDIFGGMSYLEYIKLDGNMWNCQALRNISKELASRNVTVIRGNNIENVNVLGVACYEHSADNSSRLDSKNEVDTNYSKLIDIFDKRFDSALYRFFESDLNKTYFVKYLLNNLENDIDAAFERKFEHFGEILFQTIKNIAKVNYTDLSYSVTNLETSLDRLDRKFDGIIFNTTQNITKSNDTVQTTTEIHSIFLLILMFTNVFLFSFVICVNFKNLKQTKY